MRLGFHPHTKASRIVDWKTSKMLFGLFSRIGRKKNLVLFFLSNFEKKLGVGVKKLTEGPYKDVVSIR
jgi:hypothetical protein